MTQRRLTLAGALLGPIFSMLGGCGQEASGPKGAAAGRFAFSFLSGIQGTASLRAATGPETPAATPASIDFNLGPIGNTTNFYFLLHNVGGATITGISITPSNPTFEAVPTAIDSLPPDTVSGIIPIIRLTAVHGTPATGIGLAPLMPQGSNSTSLTVSGVTKDNSGQSISLALSANMTVFAEVMDIRVLRGTGEVDISTPCGYAFTYLSPDPYPFVSFGTSFRNSGNVPVDVVVWYGPGGTRLEQLNLAPGAVQIWPDTTTGVTLDLNGHGVISDRTKLPIARNGHVFLGLGC